MTLQSYKRMWRLPKARLKVGTYSNQKSVTLLSWHFFKSEWPTITCLEQNFVPFLSEWLKLELLRYTSLDGQIQTAVICKKRSVSATAVTKLTEASFTLWWSRLVSIVRRPTLWVDDWTRILSQWGRDKETLEMLAVKTMTDEWIWLCHVSNLCAGGSGLVSTEVPDRAFLPESVFLSHAMKMSLQWNLNSSGLGSLLFSVVM